MNSETAQTDRKDPKGADFTPAGKFARGNKIGKLGGNPYAKQSLKMKAVQVKSTTPERMLRVWNALLDKAESGDVPACKEVFNRVYGKVKQHVEVTSQGARTAAAKAAFDHVTFAKLMMQMIQNPPIHSTGIEPARMIESQVLENKGV